MCVSKNMVCIHLLLGLGIPLLWRLSIVSGNLFFLQKGCLTLHAYVLIPPRLTLHVTVWVDWEADDYPLNPLPCLILLSYNKPH